MQLTGKRFAIKRRREASCHLLPAYTWYPFILRGDRSLGARGGQILECTWGLRGGLMCTIRWPCTMGTLKSRYAVKLHLSGLIGTASHPDMHKIRISEFFFEKRLHWQFEFRLLVFTGCKSKCKGLPQQAGWPKGFRLG